MAKKNRGKESVRVKREAREGQDRVGKGKAGKSRPKEKGKVRKKGVGRRVRRAGRSWGHDPATGRAARAKPRGWNPDTRRGRGRGKGRQAAPETTKLYADPRLFRGGRAERSGSLA